MSDPPRCLYNYNRAFPLFSLTCSSFISQILNTWEMKAPGTLDLKGQSEKRQSLCCSCARFSPLSEGAQNMCPGCPRDGGIVGKGGETREERFSIRVRARHEGRSSGRL